MASVRECKTVLLGQESSGKSALLERLLNDQFNERGPAATVGVSYAAKRVQSGHGEVVISVWDTAGAEKFDSLSRLYYSGAHAALICIDLTSGPSFAKSQHWVKQLREHQPDCRCYIVLTKCDLLEFPPAQLPARRCLSVSPVSPDTIQAIEADCSQELGRQAEQDRDIESPARFEDSYPLEIKAPRKRRQLDGSPAAMLDRQGSSFGSTASRTTGTSGSSFDQPRPYKRKAVSDSQLQSLARSIDAQLIYTSAATGQGVAELFQMVAEDQAASHGERISVERKSESRSQSRRSSSETTRQVERNDIVQLEGTQSCYRATRDACCK